MPLLPHEPVIWRVVLAAKPRLQGRPPAPITYGGAHLPAWPLLPGRGWGGATWDRGGDGVLPPTCWAEWRAHGTCRRCGVAYERSCGILTSWSWSRLTHLPTWLPGILSRQEPCLMGKQRRNRATPGHLGADGRALSPVVLPNFRCCFIQQGSGHLLLLGAQWEQRWLPWDDGAFGPEQVLHPWTNTRVFLDSGEVTLLSSGHRQPQSSWHPWQATGSEMPKQALGILEVTGNCGTFCTEKTISDQHLPVICSLYSTIHSRRFQGLYFKLI